MRDMQLKRGIAIWLIRASLSALFLSSGVVSAAIIEEHKRTANSGYLFNRGRAATVIALSCLVWSAKIRRDKSDFYRLYGGRALYLLVGMRPQRVGDV